MKRIDRNTTQLRHAAEAQLSRVQKLGPHSAEELLHELQAHQIELEIKNDILRVALLAFEESLERTADLYNQSPVGYCTVNEYGLILQANLTAVTLLGTDREALIKQTISRFIFKADQDIYYLLRKRLGKTNEPQACELRMVKNDGTQFWAHLVATDAVEANGATVIRILMSDVTERKRLEEALISVAENRQRSIGQELHDSLGQQLAAIAYQSSALEKKLLTSRNVDSAGVAASIAAQAQHAVMQCKQLAQSMLPFELEANGLMAALQAFASRIARTYKIACGFMCPNEVIIDDANLALNLYRIAQEAANNAIRHGEARHLTISLSFEEGLLRLSVCDDGCGFADADTIATSGMGVKIMQYRAKQFGATLKFLPRPEGGTEVRVEMNKAKPC
jgi:PAS domain S-box-containing protein